MVLVGASFQTWCLFQTRCSFQTRTFALHLRCFTDTNNHTLALCSPNHMPLQRFLSACPLSGAGKIFIFWRPTSSWWLCGMLKYRATPTHLNRIPS
ncbi:hypothetical protein BJV77DRAFT_1009011, partial [Russula vinacea]